MEKGGKQGALEEAGEDQVLGGCEKRETGSTGEKRRETMAWGMGKGGKQGALEEGGGDSGLGWEREGNMEHWRKEERIKGLGMGKEGNKEHLRKEKRIKGLGDGKGREIGST